MEPHERKEAGLNRGKKKKIPQQSPKAETVCEKEKKGNQGYEKKRERRAENTLHGAGDDVVIKEDGMLEREV